MKLNFKRLLAALLLICLLVSMVVPATFAQNDPAEAITYDFEMYNNADLIADSTEAISDANFNCYSCKYDGSKRLYAWFHGNSAAFKSGKINWQPESSNGEYDADNDTYGQEMKNFAFRGANQQGMRLHLNETSANWAAIRIQVPTAGAYSVKLNVGTVSGSTAVYIFAPDAAANGTGNDKLMSDRNAGYEITPKLTAANAVGGNGVTLPANAQAVVGNYNFPAAGEYIVVFQTTADKDIYLDSMVLETVASSQPEETTTAAETTAAVITGTDVSYNFNLVTGYADHFGSNDKSKFNKVENKLAGLYPDTVNWNYEDSGNGSDKIELRVAQGLRLNGTAGDWAAFRLSGITAGYYDIALTSTGATTMNFADVYLVKAAEGLDIAGAMTANNLVCSANVKTGGTYSSNAPVALEDGEYILIVKQTAANSSGYICLTALALTAVAEPPETTAPSETTAPETTTVPETTVTTEPTEPFVPEVDQDGIFDFNVIVSYPELCGGLNTRHYDKKAVHPDTSAIKDENGKDMKIKKYLESLYKKDYIDWVLEDASFQNGKDLENIELRTAQGLRIYGTAGDYVAFRLTVPVADTYNLLLTSGGSNLMNIYLAEATEGMDIAGAMCDENLLVSDVKAASKAAIKQEVKLEAKEYILIVKHMTGDGTTYWTLAQLALEKWQPKQAVPMTDKMVYDFDLVSMDGQFIKKTMTNRYVDGGIRVSAKINEMYQEDRIQWIYEGASETFPVKEFSFRENSFRLKASVNTKKINDPWIAFRLENPGTGTYDVRLISGDKSQVCVNIYLIPAPSTLTLTNDQIKAGMNEDNLLVKNAQIDAKGTFYLGDYTFGVEDEYLMVLDFIKGGAMYLSQIEMTKDGLVADGTVKHGTTYNGVVYDLDLADQMDGIYSDSTVYMPDVIDDMNSRWASGELNWKFMRASEDLSGAATATTSKPSTKLRYYRSSGMRAYGAPDSWVALKIKSPGSGDFTVTINHAVCANSGTMAMYVLPADTDPENYWNATDPENRIGKVTLTNAYGDAGVEDGYTSFVGYWNFEAGKEYILVLECYAASNFNAARCYMNISQIVMQRGKVSYDQEDGEKKVTAMAVAPNALPVADPSTSAVVQEINGHDWYFLPVEGGYLLVYDLDTGKLVDKVKTPFNRVDHAVGLMDGKIWIGDGFVYDPYTGETYTVPNIKSTPGFEDVQDMTGIFVDPDGVTIWFGCNYGAQMGSYNLETREYTYYGQPYGYQNRITGLNRRGDYLYGCVHGDNLNKIFKWDINAKKIVADYDVNDLMGTASYIRSLGFLGDDYIVMGGNNFSGFVVLDPDTMEAVDIGLYSYPNLEITEEIDGKQYMLLVKYGLYEYDIATKTVTKVPGFGTEGIGFRTGAYRGNSKSVVTLDGDTCLFTYTSSGGHPRLFNLTTKEYQSWDNLVVDGTGGSPLRTFLSWGEGSNRFSFGGFNTDMCAVYNTELGKVEFYYLTAGQTDTHTMYDGKLYAANYSSTTLNEIYPDETQTSIPVTNDVIQRWRLDHEETGQKRLHASTAGDGYVFVGTTPDSDLTGGGIVVYDTKTGRWFFDRAPVENGSINGMAYHDQLLYCTTSLYGGSGSEIDTSMSAVLFVYDYKTKEVIATMDPRDHISGLPAGAVHQVLGVTPDPKVAENGRFWSIVSDVLFCFTFDKEAKTFQVQEVISFSKNGYSDQSTDRWWPKAILFDTDNNYIYANFTLSGGSQRIEIENWDAPVGQVKAIENTRFMADAINGNYALIGDDGNLYYANGADIKMYPLNLTDEDWAIAKQVDDLFLAIGDEITLESEAAVKSARSAYENLNWRYKALIQNLEVLQEAESDVLECKIATLEAVEMTADDYPAMLELINEYKGLNNRQQRYVKNYSLLKEKYNQASDLNDQRIAAAMQERIDALSGKFPMTLELEPEVIQLRTDYKELTAKQSVLVDATLLEKAETEIAVLRAEFVVYTESLIQAIPEEITLDAEPAITAAREAADKLYMNERKEVSYSKLTSAEGKLRTLKNAKAAAEEVDALIDAIGIVTLGDKDRIAQAREAYDALNGTALTFLENGNKLVRAEWILKALQTWGIPVIAVVDLAAIALIFRKKLFKGKKKETTEE